MSLKAFRHDTSDRNDQYDFLSPSMNPLLLEVVDIARGLTINQGPADRLCLTNGQSRLKCQDPRDKIFSMVCFADGFLPADFVDYRQLFTSQNRPWKPPTCTVEGQLAVSGRIDVVGAEIETVHRDVRSYLCEKGKLDKLLQDSYQETRSHIRRREAPQDGSQRLGMSAMTSSEHETQKASPTFIRKFLRAVFYDGIDVAVSDRESFFGIFVSRSEDLDQNKEVVPRRYLHSGLHTDGRLLIIESGRLGFVDSPGLIPEIGDRVAILRGLDVPCLLRNPKDGEGWLFVTTIYVDGMMYGEGESISPHFRSISNHKIAVDWEEDEADTFILDLTQYTSQI